jgi:hypothetical protein
MTRSVRFKSHEGLTDMEGHLVFAEDEKGELAVYIKFNGKVIAKRYRGGHWITLVPGYTVVGGDKDNYDTITVTHRLMQ